MNNLYVGLLKRGGTVVFKSLDILDEFEFVGYFPVDEIPQGEGVMRTDGISQIWFEKEPATPEIKTFAEMLETVIDQI